MNVVHVHVAVNTAEVFLTSSLTVRVCSSGSVSHEQVRVVEVVIVYPT